MIHSRPRLLAVISALLLLSAGAARAQVVPAGVDSGASAWNSPRALELIDRARARRAVPRADSGLVNYAATAAGYVYFFLDRTDSEERSLVRVDQLALEVYWAAPNRTKQRIIGMRDASKLPNRMQYHLDHLTVVQDEFGDRIRLGDGDEVRDVLHPAAPGSSRTYDFRLVDSLTIRLAGSAAPIHVHEIEVRPRDPDQPAFIGSIFLDQTTAAIVRLNFTFTPSSYVDRRLDYIHVGLDNGLWEGRYWLPNEQTLEIRRQVPVLDFPAGSVIRGVLRISDYRFNQELPPTLFRGARVVAAPRDAREAHEFPAGIFAELDQEGLPATTDLAALRRQATDMLGRRYLSGLPRLRLYLPNSSAVLRYNRAESLYLGGGVSYLTGSTSRLRLATGYATGANHLALSGDWQLEPARGTALWLRAERHALRDLGVRPGLPGVLNTIAAAGFGEDHLDPYFATGASLGVERRLGADWRAGIAAGYERHRNARLEEESAIFNGAAEFRPIREIATGPLLYSRLMVGRGSASAPGWSGTASVEAGHFAGASYLRPTIEGAFSRDTKRQDAGFELRGAAGLLTGTAPPQARFLLGGPATLAGYPYRGFVGDRFALLGLEAHHDLDAPWVRLRAVGAAGWTGLGASPPPAGWGTQPTDGLKTSLGAGLGLFYDLLRIDLVRGLQRQGRWQWVISVSPAIADIL
jgi:hypothetical protein